MNEEEGNIMLMATPKEIIGKMKYENGKPVAIGVLTEEEQQVFDKFCDDFEWLQKKRFVDEIVE